MVNKALKGFVFFLDKKIQMVFTASHSSKLTKGNSGTMFANRSWRGFYIYYRGGPSMR